MNEDNLINLLRTHTAFGRMAGGEVRHTLEYMRSIGFVMKVSPAWFDRQVVDAVGNGPLDRTLSSLFPARAE